MKIRTAAVKGSFYPASKEEINKLIAGLYITEKDNFISLPDKINLTGGVVPHAAIHYSGRQAVHFFNAVKKSAIKYDTFVIVHPNHTNVEKGIMIDDNQFWETPLGMVEIDNELGEMLAFKRSSSAQITEHSAEIMLPFLQFSLNYGFKIMPVIMNSQNLRNAKILAGKLFLSARELNRKILLIASSDFSHFVTPQYGEMMDNLVIDQIKNFNTQGIYNTVSEYRISMCGYGPVMALTEYSLLLSKNPCFKILRRGHSGEISQMDDVVDYICGICYY